jgi:hypothetical protein
MPPVPVEEDYPRTYRLATDRVVFQAMCGPILTLGGVSAGCFNGLVSFTRFPDQDSILIAAALITGHYLIVDIVRFRVTLFADRIEIRTLLQTHVLMRNQILGWRRWPMAFGPEARPRSSPLDRCAVGGSESHVPDADLRLLWCFSYSPYFAAYSW